MPQEIQEADELGDLYAVVEPLQRADKKDWDRLEAYLAKDGSGYGHFWQALMKEVRQALESKDMLPSSSKTQP